MLSRKYYRGIAKIIRRLPIQDGRQYYSDLEEIRRDDLIDALVDYFKKDNPRFDIARFRIACEEE